MFDKKTKIIATIGPASLHKSIVSQLIKDGVNIFRFNMKHSSVEWHSSAIEIVQCSADDLGVPIGILIDLQGPEIRIEVESPRILEKDDLVTLTYSASKKKADIKVKHRAVIKALVKGDTFAIDDGFIHFEVIKKRFGMITAKALDDGKLENHKGLNLIGKDVDLPSLIEEDIERLSVATIRRVDFVALSFVRSKNDVETLRDVMKERNVKAQIISKVESRKGVDNIDEIIDVSDAVMIARGDLGIEIPIEEITYYQKLMINKCRQKHRPVIVATQMLQSMIDNPLPTRAEATDVANAVFDGTDAIMLSGETATGKYPVKAVAAMSRIATFNEEKAIVTDFEVSPENPTELIVEAAESIAAASNSNKLKIDFIVVFTDTGYTARVVSSFRPKIPIIAVTSDRKTVETLTLSYGVTPFQATFPTGKVLSPDNVIKQLKKKKILQSGQMTLLIHGQHWKHPGQTNAIVLYRVE